MLTTFARLGAVNGFLAVALGAFGAHGLRDRLSERMLDTYQTGAHYHLVHAVALLFVGLLAERVAGDAGRARLVRLTGWLFVCGITVFSGSLYALAVSGVTRLGVITPLGGLCFLSGWAVLAVAASGRTPPPSETPGGNR